MRALRIAVFLAVAGLLLAAVAGREWRVHRAIEAGARADALVTGFGRCPGWQSCTPSEAVLAVTFRLDDGTPQAANVTVDETERHPIGSHLALRYDPRRPDRAEYVDHGSQALGAFVTGLVFVLASIAVAAFFHRPSLVA